MKIGWLFLSLLPFSLQATFQEDEWARRVHAHMVIRDDQGAIKEAQQALLLYPHSSLLHESYIRALAKGEDEKKIMQAWDVYHQLFPEKAINKELIEEMAWGILQKASQSPSLIMREMALLAALFSQDAKGVAILHQGMRDTNYAVRALAVQMASEFRDQKLIEEVKRLFREEKVWSVRQQVIKAIGKMKIVALRQDLEQLIGSNESVLTEKTLAITALLELLETLHRTEMERLASSNRTGLRQLACKAIAHFQSLRDLDQLWQLAEDPQSSVRLAALQALGQLRPQEQQQQTRILALARQGTQDRHYQVALSAAWLLTLYAPEEGQIIFSKFLLDHRREVRSLAAAVLGATGRYGVMEALYHYQTHPDPYVRLNLAFGLLGQRQATQECALYIKQMVVADKEKWKTQESGIFRAILVRYPDHVEEPMIAPENDDQLLRLEFLHLLAMLDIPGTQQAIREYLLKRSWEVSATAAALLLTEGDESAIELVVQLLQDPQPRIRLQAALILSLWSREEKAIQALEEGYSRGNSELKAKVLEGLGRIGSSRSLPFLIERLKEPSQTLRLIAAVAIIQCLHH